jgi:hypothetical protein
MKIANADGFSSVFSALRLLSNDERHSMDFAEIA